MPNKNLSYGFDLAIQAIVLFPMLICYLFVLSDSKDSEKIIFALLCQLAVGAVQLLSGLYFSIAHRSTFHRKYLGITILYLFFLFMLFSGINDNIESFAVVFMGIIPIGIAIWYIFKSKKYHENYDRTERTLRHTNDSLLDDYFQA